MKAARLLFIPALLILHAVTSVWAVDSLAGFTGDTKAVERKAKPATPANTPASPQTDWMEDEDE